MTICSTRSPRRWRGRPSAGIAQVTHPLTWPGWGGDNPDEASTTLFAYRNFKSMVFLTETAESNEFSHPAAIRMRSGMAKLKALLEHGHQRHPKLYYSGYPCQLVTGVFVTGLVAIGKTARERRACRIDAWKARPYFRKLSLRAPEEAKVKQTTLQYDGPVLEHGIGVQGFARGRLAIKHVMLNGRRLRESQTNGYYSWHDGPTTLTVIAIPRLAPGEYRIETVYR